MTRVALFREDAGAEGMAFRIVERLPVMFQAMPPTEPGQAGQVHRPRPTEMRRWPRNPFVSGIRALTTSAQWSI